MKKIKKRLLGINLLLANVFNSTAKTLDNSINNQGDKTLTDTNHEVNATIDLATALQRGILTQEVIELRARYYKTTKEIGRLGSNGKKIDFKQQLSRIKVDGELETNELKFQITNIKAVIDSFTNEKAVKLNFDYGNEIAKFPLSTYCDNVIVRTGDVGFESILEFVIPISDEIDYLVNYKALGNRIEEAINSNDTNRKLERLFVFNELSVETDGKDIGIEPYLKFGFKYKAIHSVTKFNNNYYVKITTFNTVNGEDSFIEYESKELNEKYDKTIKRNNPLKIF